MARTNQMDKGRREFCKEAVKFAKDPSPKALREHILGVCMAKGYDPVIASIDFRNELVGKLEGRRRLRKDAGPKKVQQDQRYEVEILKLIAGVDRDIARYVYPIVKAYDVQGSVDQSLTVKLIQFATGEEVKEKVIDDGEVDIDLGTPEQKMVEAAMSASARKLESMDEAADG